MNKCCCNKCINFKKENESISSLKLVEGNVFRFIDKGGICTVIEVTPRFLIYRNQNSHTYFATCEEHLVKIILTSYFCLSCGEFNDKNYCRIGIKTSKYTNKKECRYYKFTCSPLFELRG